MPDVYWWVFVTLLAYFAALNTLYLTLTLGGLREGRDKMREAGSSKPEQSRTSRAWVPVSVVIPAFNEALAIVESVLSALRSDYPQFEVIVISDGSTDRTVEATTEEFSMEPIGDVSGRTEVPTNAVREIYRSRIHRNLWLIDKENGGSADACNAGLNLARHPYIVHLDADTILEPDALARTMRPANVDPDRVVAIGSQLRVLNGFHVDEGRVIPGAGPKRLVERFQVLEYLGAFLVNRLGWAKINCTPVLAGGYSVWRADVLLELGGYSTDVTHEDIESTLAFHSLLRRERRPYAIVQLPDPVAWTHVPSRWRDLTTQRRRWQRVVFEVVWLHRRMLLNPRYGAVGMVTMPYLLLYEGLGPFIEAFAYAFVVMLAILGHLNTVALILFCTFSFGLTAFMRLISVLVGVTNFNLQGRRAVVTLVLLALIEPISYRLILLPTRMAALFEFLFRRRTHPTSNRAGFGHGGQP